MSTRNTSRALAAPSSLLSRCQRGQASVEYLGVIVASALLVLAVLSTPLPRMLGHAVAQAICDVSAVHGCQVGSPQDNGSQQTAHPAPQRAPLPSREPLDGTGARADAIHSAALTGASDTGTQTVDLPVPGQRNAQAEVEEFVRCLRQAQPSAHCRSVLRAPRDQSPSPDQRLRAEFQRACRVETYVPSDALFVPRSPCQARFEAKRNGTVILTDLAQAPGLLGVIGAFIDETIPNTAHPASFLSFAALPALDGLRAGLSYLRSLRRARAVARELRDARTITARAEDVHRALDPIARGRRTTSVLRTADKHGKTVDVLAGGQETSAPDSGPWRKQARCLRAPQETTLKSRRCVPH